MKQAVVFFFLCLFFSFTAFSQSFKPTDLPNLKLWLAADTGVVHSGGAVSQWNDLSGNNYHVEQPTPSLQPLLINNVLNNMPVVRFDGVNDYLIKDFGQSYPQPITVFIVWNITTAGGYATQMPYSNFGAWGGTGISTYLQGNQISIYAGNQFFPYSKNKPFDFILNTSEYNLSQSKVFENGLLKGQGNAGNFPLYGITLGGTVGNNYYLTGDIAEFIVYDVLMHDTVRSQIETYLWLKYFLEPVDLGADINMDYGFCDTFLLAAPLSFDTYMWSTGATTSSISVSQTGTYSVTAADAFGFSSTDSINISVLDVHVLDTLICFGDTITVSAGIFGAYSYLWNTGETTPSVSIWEANTYWLRVTDSLGCYKTDTFNLYVDSMAYYAAFASDTLALCAGNHIALASGTNLVSQYLWLPGGATSPSISVQSSGDFVLTVWSANGCDATLAVYADVQGAAPVPGFSISGACVGDSIHFTDLSFGPDGISNWEWLIPGVDTSYLQHPVFVFDTAGSYTLHFKVTSPSGCYKDSTAVFSIYDKPQVYFTYFPACVGLAVNFEDQTIMPPGASLSARTWYVDGVPSGSQNVLNTTFTSAGTHLVGLEILADNSCSSRLDVPVSAETSYPLPEPFSLISPPAAYTISGASWQFSWNAAPNAIKYVLELAADSNFSALIYQSPHVYGTSHTLPALAQTSLYWRVKAYNPCNSFIASVYRSLFTFDASQIPGLLLWFAADTGVVHSGGAVSQWNDLSGNNYHVEQPTPSLQPQWVNNVLNNKPVVRFDGVNDYLIKEFPQSVPQPITVFIVWNITTAGGYATQMPYSNFGSWGSTGISTYLQGNHISIYAGNQFFPYTKNKPFDFILNTSEYNLSQSNVFENGILKGQGDVGNFPLYGFTLGGTVGNNYNLTGDIAEVLVVDTVLSSASRAQVEHYLMDKYAPPVNLGADIYMLDNLCDTVLDAGGGYVSYLWSTGATASYITVDANGTYWVKATDIFGRESADTLVVHKPVFAVSDTTICVGTSAQIHTGTGSSFNYLWSTGDTTEGITISAAGQHWVEVFDSYGCSLLLPFEILHDNYELDVTLGPDRAICMGEAIELQNGAAETHSYIWSTGDTTAAIIPQAAGTYTVETVNARGCQAHDTIAITFNGYMPSPQFLYNAVCEGTAMPFVNTSQTHSSDPLVGSYWDFGAAIPATSTQHTPLATFSQYGLHPVTLTTVTAAACSASITLDVLVYDKPMVNFTPVNGCVGAPIDFYDHSVLQYGQVQQWEWAFGDGGNSNLEQPAHTYTDEGTYTAMLKATSSHGCADSLTKNINIRQGPVVDFSYTDVCFGQDVQFTNNTQTYPWAQIYEQTWHFGDGISSSLAHPVHTYLDSAGYYDVSLTVKSLNGCVITKTKQLKVHDIPVADFLSTTLCAGEPAQFFDISTVANDSITIWHWQFADIATATVRNPWVIFPDSGIFNVNLAVTSSANCSHANTFVVEVYPTPKAVFSLSLRYGTAPLTVYFSNQSLGANTYVWHFGDNLGSSTQTHPVYTYMQNGIYTVELTASNNKGCHNTAYDEVKIIPTLLDVAVLEVGTKEDDDFLSVYAHIANLGTRPVDKLNLFAVNSNGLIFREYWEGMLLPGDVLDFSFAAQFLLNHEAVDFVCVRAETMEIENDMDLSNNEKCVSLTTEFRVRNPFPNPAIHQTRLDVILPAEDMVEIILYNTAGENLGHIYKGILEKGLTSFDLTTAELKKGVYAITVYYRDLKVVVKFVKI